jgi:hypothetical protein
VFVRFDVNNVYLTGKDFFCANTFGQRHPITGDILFVHRSLAKYVRSSEYLEYDPIPRAWTHLAKHSPRGNWQGLGGRQYVKGVLSNPLGVFLPSPSHASCVHPEGSEVVVKRVTSDVCLSCFTPEFLIPLFIYRLLS